MEINFIGFQNKNLTARQIKIVQFWSVYMYIIGKLLDESDSSEVGIRNYKGDSDTQLILQFNNRAKHIHILHKQTLNGM